MSTSAETPKKKKAWVKKVQYWGAGLVVVLVFVAFGGLNLFKADAMSDNRLHGRVKLEFAEKDEKAQNNPDIKQAISQHWDIKVEEKDLHNAITNGIHNCPDKSQWDDPVAKHYKTMDVTSCEPNQKVWLQLADSYEPEVYTVRLYKYGTGKDYETDLEKRLQKKLIFIPQEAKIESKDPSNKHFIAEQIGPYKRRLGGEVDYIHRGNADLLELVRE